MNADDLRIRPSLPSDAEVVHRLTRAAFADQARLDPPSGAMRETVVKVRADLEAHGGAIALLDDQPVGCLRYEIEGDNLHVHRLAVRPDLQGRGVGRALMAWADRAAAVRRLPTVRVGVRLGMPSNIAFYERLGFRALAKHAHPGYDRPTWVDMRKAAGTARG